MLSFYSTYEAIIVKNFSFSLCALCHFIMLIILCAGGTSYYGRLNTSFLVLNLFIFIFAAKTLCCLDFLSKCELLRVYDYVALQCSDFHMPHYSNIFGHEPKTYTSFFLLTTYPKFLMLC